MRRYVLAFLITLATAPAGLAQVAVADDHLSAIVGIELEITLGTLLGNDLLGDAFDGLEYEDPQWGQLIEEEVEGKPFFRYKASAQEMLASVTGIDHFTYRVRSGSVLSEKAVVFIKVYPDRTPLAGRWRHATPAVDTDSGLGWYDAASSTFHLCGIYFYPTGDGYLDDCESFELPVEVPGGGEPLVGDWDGDGFDDLGVYDSWQTTFYLYTIGAECGDFAAQDCAKLIEHARLFRGWADAMPVAGDWHGQGRDVVGFYDPASKGFSLLRSNSATAAADWISFAPKGRPIAGQWDVWGAADDSVGVFDRVTKTVHYLVNGGIESRELGDLPAFGMPFSFSWNDYSWIGIRDPEAREMLLLSHPDIGRKTRRVSVPKDP